MIEALIIAIALEVGVPAQFMLAILQQENPQYIVTAVHYNTNGTVDRGLFQLNSSWFNSKQWADPETNIRAACLHVKMLKESGLTTTWWSVALAYNAGLSCLKTSVVPLRSTYYADRVIAEWSKTDTYWRIVL